MRCSAPQPVWATVVPFWFVFFLPRPSLPFIDTGQLAVHSFWNRLLFLSTRESIGLKPNSSLLFLPLRSLSVRLAACPGTSNGWVGAEADGMSLLLSTGGQGGLRSALFVRLSLGRRVMGHASMWRERLIFATSESVWVTRSRLGQITWVYILNERFLVSTSTAH